jgi:hypothetical protein
MRLKGSTGLLAVLAAVTVMAGSPAPAAAENPNLTASDRGPCRDPWINYAYRTQHNRSPVGQGDAGECNIYLYAAGRWQNYDELRNSVNSWVRTTSNAGQAMKSVGSVFTLVDRKSGGQLRAVVRALDKAGVGRMFDMMGQAVRSFGLMSTDRQTDLGGGTTLIVR